MSSRLKSSSQFTVHSSQSRSISKKLATGHWQLATDKVRVRFAPSPSGYLHLGGARTALYNFLFARKHQGKFILRIEDTDKTRSTEEAIKAITGSLSWLGSDFDEGPFRQTNRLKIYQKFAQKLLNEGKAYQCFCLPEELKERRKEAQKKGKAPRYDRRCLHLKEAARKKFEAEGRKPALRFLTPDEGVTTFADLIRGQITFENKDLDDFIILRSDDFPTYNFAVVIDDYEMKITHIIRGEDHLSNTPKQALLYQALGWEFPKFAHLPMIVGKDRAPLSKRHGAVSIVDYKAQGYLPEALLNYLALLGWSYDETQTIFSKEELIKKFSLGRVTKSAALFDLDKLNWLNGYYIRKLPLRELALRIVPFLEQAGLVKEPPSPKWLRNLAKIVQERIKTLAEVVPLADFFFLDEVKFDSKAQAVLKGEEVGKILKLAAERLSSLKDFEAGKIEPSLRKLQQELGLKPKEVFQPIRAAVTGKMVSPPLFETLELLGQEKTLSRLHSALKSEAFGRLKGVTSEDLIRERRRERLREQREKK